MFRSREENLLAKSSEAVNVSFLCCSPIRTSSTNELVDKTMNKNWWGNHQIVVFGGLTALVLSSLIGIYKLSQQRKVISEKSEKHNYPQDHGDYLDDIFELLNAKTWNDQRIIEALRKNPSLAKLNDQKGRLPLHVALSKPHPNIKIVQLLLDLYPEGAQVKDRFWQALPLHFCVHKDREDLIELELIELVLHAYPEATSTTDGANFLPIHRAVNRVLPHSGIIALLLQADINSAKIPTSNGNTCLHWLLSQPFPRTSIDLAIIEKVFLAYPQALFIKNNEKKSPADLLISKAALEDADFVEEYGGGEGEREGEEGEHLSRGNKLRHYGAKYILGHLLELSQSLTPLSSSSSTSSSFV